MFKDFIYYLEKLYVIIAIYIQIGKKTRQIILNDYIYRLAKRCGKSSEIQTHNYRQL